MIEPEWIPAGVFMMASPEGEASRDADEGFWMMTTEVRQGQYQAVTGYNPSFSKNGPAHPWRR